VRAQAVRFRGLIRALSIPLSISTFRDWLSGAVKTRARPQRRVLAFAVGASSLPKMYFLGEEFGSRFSLDSTNQRMTSRSEREARAMRTFPRNFTCFYRIVTFPLKKRPQFVLVARDSRAILDGRSPARLLIPRAMPGVVLGRNNNFPKSDEIGPPRPMERGDHGTAA